MPVHIFPSEVDTIFGLATYIAELANNAIQDHGMFSLVLSGGNTPKQLYETLAQPPFRDKVLWSKVFFFLGDERYVPLTDKDSNYNMVSKSLFEPLQIAEEQIFGIDTSLPAEEAAASYEQNIQTFFKNKDLVFDLTLLGLGDNVHTASLFPGTAVLNDKLPAVKSVFIAELNAFRITMNAPLINLSQHIVFLVMGAGKAMAVLQVLQGIENRNQFPAQLIRTYNTSWYLDETAAKYL